MIQRVIVLSILLIIFTLTINWVLEDRSEPEVQVQGNEPDLYMRNATINQYGSGGQLQHRVSAERFTHFPLTNLTTMNTPKLVLGNPNEKSPWKIASELGRILPKSDYREEVLELWDNVVAEQNRSDGRFINIKTDSLTVYPEREYLETDTKVYIDNESGRTTAAGMKADLSEGRFMFFSNQTDRVITIYLPNPAGI